MSLRTRLSILTAVAVGLTVAVAALVSYVAVRDQLSGQIDKQLANEMAVISQRSGGGNDSTAAILRAISASPAGRGDIAEVVSTSGATGVNGVDVLAPTPAEEAFAGRQTGSPDAFLSTRTVDGTVYRLLIQNGFPGIDVETGQQVPVAVEIAHPMTDLLRTLRELRLVLLLVGLSGIAVAVAAGLAVARATIRPVERLTAAAEHVTATQDLDATIDDDGRDELARLAHSFNAMLAALRSSRQQQAQLISDAGHELRTPLTSLRTNIEVLLSVEHLPAEDRADLLGDVRAQLEELTVLIGDLVELGRQEERQPEPTEVRLDAIVDHAVERARRRAIGTRFDVSLEAGSVRAQPPLLERAVLNVLDNAAKFSPPGGHIGVTLRRGATWRLEVRDHGPGIPAEDLPHVLDRFYRAQSARSLPGSGLGLAIVAQVVASHHGSVAVTCPDDGGTLVAIELPTVAEAEAPPHAAGAVTGMPAPPLPGVTGRPVDAPVGSGGALAADDDTAADGLHRSRPG